MEILENFVVATARSLPKPSELPIDERIARLKFYLQEAEEYNIWRKNARKVVAELTPRVYALGNKLYAGCGFHYSLEQELGQLITNLALPWEPCMNWIDKCPEQSAKCMVYQVCFEHLVKSVEDGEKSAQELQNVSS